MLCDSNLNNLLSQKCKEWCLALFPYMARSDKSVCLVELQYGSMTSYNDWLWKPSALVCIIFPEGRHRTDSCRKMGVKEWH